MSQGAFTGAGQNTATVSTSLNGGTRVGSFGAANFLVTGWNSDPPVQLKNRTASTLKGLSVQVGADAKTHASTLTSQVGGSAGNQSVSIPASTAGVFSDSTHTDSLADGAFYNYKIVMGADTGAIHIAGISAELDTANQCFSVLAGNASGANFNASTVIYASFAGTLTPTSTEASTQEAAMESATLSNLQGYCSGGAGTMTLGTRIAGGAGNQTITVISTAFAEDTTHTDSLTGGSLFNAANTAGAPTMTSLGVKYLSANAGVSAICTGGATATGSAATNFWPMLGQTSKSTTESDTTIPAPVAGTLSTLTVRVTVNTNASAETFNQRNGGVTGNGSVSITGSTTGIFKDVTHTDSVVLNGLICCTSASGLTTTTTLAGYGALFTGPASTTITRDGIGVGETLGSLVRDGLARDENLGAVVRDGLARDENLGALTRDGLTRTEDLAVLTRDGLARTESLGALNRDGLAQIEAQGALSRDGVAGVENLGALRRDGVAQIEALGSTVARDGLAQIESLGALQADGSGRIEVIGAISRDGLAWSEDIAALIADSLSQIETQGSLQIVSDALAQIEALGSITADGIADVEAFGSLASDGSVWIEWLAAVEKDAAAHGESLGSILAQIGIALETIGSIFGDAPAISQEALAAIQADGRLNIEFSTLKGIIAKVQLKGSKIEPSLQASELTIALTASKLEISLSGSKVAITLSGSRTAIDLKGEVDE